MRAGRLNSRARVWRSEEKKDEFRNTVTVWSVVEKAWVRVAPPKRLLSSYGAGEQATGTMEVEMRDGVDLRMRDVVEVYAGPEKGTKWRVLTTHRPGYGNLLALLEVDHTTLPEAP